MQCVEDPSEDEPLNSKPLPQVLPRMQPDLDIAYLSVNTVEYSSETNIHANSINDTINNVYDSDNNSSNIEYEQNVDIDIDNDHMIMDVHNIRKRSKGGNKKRKGVLRRRRDRKLRNKVGI